MSGWPAPDKSGYPANPEQNGWHWIQTSGGTEPWYWLKDQGDDGDFGWEAYDGIWSAANIAHSKAIYLGPCLTPSEVDALKAKIARLREENDRLRNHHKKIWTESYHAMLAGEVKP